MMAGGAFDPLTAGLQIGSQLIDRLWPDPATKAAASAELLKMQLNGELAIATGQLEVNKAEAASPSVFVAGWRPFIGWACGMGCVWNWLGLPMALFVAECLGRHVNVRAADLSEMMPLLAGMLGIGGLRTIEKIKGVA